MYYSTKARTHGAPRTASRGSARGKNGGCNHRDASGDCRVSRWEYVPYHLPPCCTGNQQHAAGRLLPNFMQHMAFGASAADGAGRGGVAVALCGPSVVQLQVGAGSAQPEVSATINVSTAFRLRRMQR